MRRPAAVLTVLLLCNLAAIGKAGAEEPPKFGTDMLHPLGSPEEFRRETMHGSREDRVGALAYCLIGQADYRSRKTAEAFVAATEEKDSSRASAKFAEMVFDFAGVAMNICGIEPTVLDDLLGDGIHSYGRFVFNERFDKAMRYDDAAPGAIERSR